MLAARVLGISLTALAAFVACGGNSSEHDGDGTSGTSGAGVSATGGSAGTSGSAGSATSGSSGTSNGGTTSNGGSTTGGSAGTTTSGGAAGTAATGGDAGAAPTGGTAGTATGGSGGGGGRECETAADCRMFTDCCNCEAVPIGADIPGCDLVCVTDHCSAQQIRSDEVACSFGRCVIDRSCDQSRITCTTDPEPCPSGLVHSVNDTGCYGACLPPTDCRNVTDCASCGDGEVCVIAEPQIPSYGCVRPGASCTKGNYCECLDPCPTSGFECIEQSDAVHCPCPVC